MREGAAVLEKPSVPKAPKPLPRDPDRRWSHTAFAEAWSAAKKANPKLRTTHLSTPCGVDPATVRNWRRGKGQPGVDQWFALASVLGIDPFALTEPIR